MTDAGVVSGGTPPSPAVVPRWPWLVFGLLSVVSVALFLRVGRGLTWFFDEWGWVLDRRTGGLDDVLTAHNGHLNAIPVLVYKAYWAAFGLEDYTGMRVVVLLLHLAVCAVLLSFLRSRLSDPLALVLTTAILFLGTAWQDLLWPFQIQYLGSMLGGLVALVLLDRRDRVGDVGACLGLVAALACSGVGLPFLGAVVVRLVLRRRDWARWWVVVVPAAVYGTWYVSYGTSQAKASNVTSVPGYVGRAAAASGGSLLGSGDVVGAVAVVAIALAVVVVVVRQGRMSPELASLVLLPISFWALTGLSRGELGEPGASRYLYPGAIFLVLILGQLAGDRAWPRERRWRAAVWAAAAGLLVLSLVGNVRELRAGAAGLRGVSNHVQAELAALELVADRVDPSYRPDVTRAPQITAGPYLDAVAELGSPAASLDEVRSASEEVRHSADRVLLEGTGAGIEPVDASAGRACQVVTVGSGALAIRDGEIGDGLVVTAGTAPVVVQSQLFATDWMGGVLGEVVPGTSSRVEVPALDVGGVGRTDLLDGAVLGLSRVGRLRVERYEEALLVDGVTSAGVPDEPHVPQRWLVLEDP